MICCLKEIYTFKLKWHLNKQIFQFTNVFYFNNVDGENHPWINHVNSLFKQNNTQHKRKTILFSISTEKPYKCLFVCMCIQVIALQNICVLYVICLSGFRKSSMKKFSTACEKCVCLSV